MIAMAVSFLILGFIAIIGIPLAHRLYFSVLPSLAIQKYQQSDPDRLARHLARVVSTPSLLGPAQKLVARSALMQIAIAEGRHSDAVAHGRAILGVLPAAPHVTGFTPIEATIRPRLADCLEVLGRLDEAEAERRLAEACLERALETPAIHLKRGELLARKRRFDEACVEYRKALKLARESDRPLKIRCLIRLAIASQDAARPVDSLRWSEEAIALEPNPRMLSSAHQMAGLACGSLGRLEESEVHFRLAHEVEVSEGNTPASARTLASLADILRKRGKLAEAFDSSLMAEDLDPRAARLSLAVRAYVHQARGQFGEALAMLRLHDEGQAFAIPDAERRYLAVSLMDQARIEAESGRGDDAWVHIREASSELSNDPKLAFICRAIASWILAVRGLADESRRVADLVEARLPEFDQDPSTRRTALYVLGMAAWVLGDHLAGETFWTRFLELSPDPIHLPTAYYVKGESLRLQGDLAGASADYRRALATGIETYHARLARNRLEEIRAE